MFQTNDQAPLRGAGTPEKPFGFYDATVGGGWEVPGEPYTNASDDPTRSSPGGAPRMLGGRTNHWGRISLRNGPYDFKPTRATASASTGRSSYEDLAPYYDKVEMLVGVYGTNEGMENTPDSPPGVLLPAPQAARQRAAGAEAREQARHPGYSDSSRRADHAPGSRTLPANLHPGNVKAQAILADAMRKRSACFWATACGRGCSIKANYQSTTVHLPPALATGNLDIITDAMVREVIRT